MQAIHRLCLGAWAEHGERTGGFYACNRYETEKKEGKVGVSAVFCMVNLSVSSCSLSNKCVGSISTMRLNEDGKWLKIPWKDTHIIMSGGHPMSSPRQRHFLIFDRCKHLR